LLVAQDRRVLDDERLRALAEGPARVPGLVGVTLGGSRAQGVHAAGSDVDLGLHYRRPLDLDGLAALAREVAGPDARVTEPGEWGPWVDGGAWLTVDGVPVDWIYRDLDRVRAAWADAQEGRHAWHAQVGHPLGVLDVAYAGEVALGVVLADPTGELAALQAAARRYPGALAQRLTTSSLWEAGFSVMIAREAVDRRDATYVAGCLFRAVGLCAHALHAHSRRWLIAEKGAVAAARGAAGRPARVRRPRAPAAGPAGHDPGRAGCRGRRGRGAGGRGRRRVPLRRGPGRGLSRSHARRRS
jgi:hypothetical protein